MQLIGKSLSCGKLANDIIMSHNKRENEIKIFSYSNMCPLCMFRVV